MKSPQKLSFAKKKLMKLKLKILWIKARWWMEFETTNDIWYFGKYHLFDYPISRKETLFRLREHIHNQEGHATYGGPYHGHNMYAGPQGYLP